MLSPFSRCLVPEDGGSIISPNRWYPPTIGLLHGVKMQKITIRKLFFYQDMLMKINIHISMLYEKHVRIIMHVINTVTLPENYMKNSAYDKTLQESRKRNSNADLPFLL
jgi:hypothetical protein